MMLKTDRLYLREMNMDDFDALYSVLADSDIMQHYPYTFDEERVRGWIERNIGRYREDGFGLWAVCLKDTGEMIGDCGLTLQTIDGEVLPEIGYHIRGDHQQMGYAKEAAKAVRDWAFRNTEYPALYSYCKHTNEASVRTAESIGMHFDREYPDQDNGMTHVSVIERKTWMEESGRFADEDRMGKTAGCMPQSVSMEKLYCGGKFHFDCLDEDYVKKASEDYRAILLGDVNRLLMDSGTIRISDHASYIGPYYFETEDMKDRDIVRKEMRMIEECTLAVFLLEDGLCPGTISELIYAATLQKRIFVFYVQDEKETESELCSPCWYPIIHSQWINRNGVTTVPCTDRRQARRKILEMLD